LYYEKLDEYLYSTSNYVPVFTPNGDGVNDYFGFTSFGFFRVFEVRVYNKWGKIVYQNNCMNDLWNGEYNGEIKPDVYYYVFSYELIGGKQESMSGTIDIKIQE
jgi:gliding motility-associated-like protein